MESRPRLSVERREFGHEPPPFLIAPAERLEDNRHRAALRRRLGQVGKFRLNGHQTAREIDRGPARYRRPRATRAAISARSMIRGFRTVPRIRS